jgi:hypothetical protein
MGTPSDVSVVPGTDPALTPFTPVVVRDGQLGLENIGSQLFVTAGGTVMSVLQSGVLDRLPLEHPLPGESTVLSMTGRWPDDAWLTLQGSGLAPVKHGPVYTILHKQGDGWIPVANERGTISFYYPHVLPWHDGSRLTLEHWSPGSWNESQDKPSPTVDAFLRARNADRGSARPRFVVLGGATTAKAPSVGPNDDVEDFAVGGNGELFALLVPRNTVNAPRLHKWDPRTDTFLPMTLPKGTGPISLRAFYTLPSGTVAVTGDMPRPEGQDPGADVSVMYAMGKDGCKETILPNPVPYVALWDGSTWLRVATPSGKLMHLTQDREGALLVALQWPTSRGRGLDGGVFKQKKGERDWTELPLPQLRFPEDGRAHVAHTKDGVRTQPGDPREGERAFRLAPSRIAVRDDGEIWIAAVVAEHQRWVYSGGSWGIGTSWRQVIVRSRPGSAVRLDDDPALWPPDR